MSIVQYTSDCMHTDYLVCAHPCSPQVCSQLYSLLIKFAQSLCISVCMNETTEEQFEDFHENLYFYKKKTGAINFNLHQTVLNYCFTRKHRSISVHIWSITH
jgi:hypothetical protein